MRTRSAEGLYAGVSGKSNFVSVVVPAAATAQPEPAPPVRFASSDGPPGAGRALAITTDTVWETLEASVLEPTRVRGKQRQRAARSPFALIKRQRFADCSAAPF